MTLKVSRSKSQKNRAKSMSYEVDKSIVYRAMFTGLLYPLEFKRLSNAIQTISYNLYCMTFAAVPSLARRGVEAAKVCRPGLVHPAGVRDTEQASPTPFIIWRMIKMGVSKPRLYIFCLPLCAHFCSEIRNLAKKCREKILRNRGLGGW